MAMVFPNFTFQLETHRDLHLYRRLEPHDSRMLFLHRTALLQYPECIRLYARSNVLDHENRDSR